MVASLCRVFELILELAIKRDAMVMGVVRVQGGLTDQGAMLTRLLGLGPLAAGVGWVPGVDGNSVHILHKGDDASRALWAGPKGNRNAAGVRAGGANAHHAAWRLPIC